MQTSVFQVFYRAFTVQDNVLIYFLLQSDTQMSQPRTIEEVRTEEEDSQRWNSLSQEFFIHLHQLESKYIRLRHGRHTRQTESELAGIMNELAIHYTDCIDYFGSISESVQVYYQIKLKDMSKYYEVLMQATSLTPVCSNKDKDEEETIQDLGSISSQTNIEMLLKERQESGDKSDDNKIPLCNREVFNQNVMLSLQCQDIGTHFKENMKKRDKVHLTINQNLHSQMAKVENRIRNRQIKIAKKKISQSFSEHTSFSPDFRSRGHYEAEQIQQIAGFDMDALQGDVDSSQKLNAYLEQKRNTQEVPNSAND